MIRRILKFLAAAGMFLLLAKTVLAAEATLYLFWASGCPHCVKEKVFLNTLRGKYPQLEIKDYEITDDRQNLLLLQEMGEKLQADVSGVPFTVIGEKYFSGYLSDETTGREIEAAINGISPRFKYSHLPLPLLTLVMGVLDGFNPCAMWTLLFLISLLLGMKDRKRMWALGIAFIASSALVYFLFLSAWLNLFLFLGLVVWVRILIGLVALGAGGYYLKDYWVNRKGGCNIMGDEKRQKIFEKIRSITQKRQFVFALGGIVLLAVAVNTVELICSAGLPAIYTKILSLSDLPTWQYYLYLLLYIFIFMLDDLFIFFTAMITLRAVGVQSKYSRYSHLIGGILMLIIGLVLLFKPELLMFG
jgi:thiol-disulfide isomerase/thioredoxin